MYLSSKGSTHIESGIGCIHELIMIGWDGELPKSSGLFKGNLAKGVVSSIETSV